MRDETLKSDEHSSVSASKEHPSPSMTSFSFASSEPRSFMLSSVVVETKGDEVGQQMRSPFRDRPTSNLNGADLPTERSSQVRIKTDS